MAGPGNGLLTEQRAEGGTYYIELNRPDKLNALSPELYAEIKQGILQAEGRPDIDVIAISGRGRAFATGGDLKHFLDLLQGAPEEVYPAFNRAYVEPTPFTTILHTPKPVVSLVDGICLAGGIVLATCSDVVIATRRSIFGVPEARVGLADPYMGPILTRIVGTMRARYLILTCADIDAETAAAWGLVTLLVDCPAEMWEKFGEVAAGLRTSSPDALAMFKESINSDLPAMDGMTVLRSAVTANGKEGLRAFAEKRPAKWVGAGTR